MLDQIQLALDLLKESQECAQAALDAHNNAHAAYVASLPEKSRELWSAEEQSRVHSASFLFNATLAAYERADLIRRAAEYVSIKRIELAAAPILIETLEKYSGKSAGEKALNKIEREIADSLGVDAVYFISLPDTNPLFPAKHKCQIRIYRPWLPANWCPTIETVSGCMVSSNNTVCVPEKLDLPDPEKLPSDLASWASEFKRAEVELEAACEAFEHAVSRSRRVALGDIHLPYHFINRGKKYD